MFFRYTKTLVDLLRLFQDPLRKNIDTFGVTESSLTKIFNNIDDIRCRSEILLLKLYDVVNCKNVINELYIAHSWHNEQMKEAEPLSRDYFIHYGRREGVRNAIEIITGEEM